MTMKFDLTGGSMAIGAGIVATVTLVTVLLSVLYVYIQRWRTYWERRNVPVLGEGIFYGIYRDFIQLRKTLGQVYRQTYEENLNLKYYGTYFLGRPTLVIQDIDISKDVLVKEFSNFPSHGFYNDPSRDPISGNLFNLDGPKWKSMRNKLIVTFTSGKIKYMFGAVQQCVGRFGELLDKELETTGEIKDLKDKLACLATDVIASVAFGVEVNTLENPTTEFREAGRRIFTPSFMEFVRAMFIMNMHRLSSLFRVTFINSKSAKFIMDMVRKMVEYREKNNIERQDFLNMMIQLKNKGYIELDGKKAAIERDATSGAITRLTIEEVAAQVFIFYAAGFETISSTELFALYELAKNKDIQRKVQEECDRVLKASNGNITYEVIQSMTYTEKVIHETLRFYSPMGAMIRATGKECKLPQTDVTLDKNTAIVIPTHGLHMDPRWFPDPERFDPERFSEEEKAKRPPCVYLPFGEGPRLCVAMRYALVQVKTAMLELLSRFDFELTKDTPVPMTLDPRAVITTPAKIDFIVTRRNRS